MRRQDSIDLISDGDAHEFSYGFVQDAESSEGTGDSYSKTQYFIYLPTSHDFDLQINAKLKSFQTDMGSLPQGSTDPKAGNPEVLDGEGQLTAFDPRFFNFKVGLKKLALLQHNLKG